ncbi:MAG: insulinase family protein [Acidobacteria bacterium]|nr:insulinase family protein [Acidobacteriota bacterium]
MTEDIKETRLENGLVVLTDRMDGVRSATLGFFYRTGSRNEPDELNGITHFIEHCVFKGSTKRSALDIAIEQDRLGGGLDAFTTHEETGFVIKVVDDQFVPAFDLLADMLNRPRFDETDLANERRVIIEEIKMNDDSPEEVLGDIFHREFFPGHPLGLSIAGTPETVASFSPELTREYHGSAFSPSNLIVAAAGNIEHDEVLELIKSLPNIDGSAMRNPRCPPAAPMPVASIVIEQRPDLEQAHLLIATPTVDARDPRRYAADLLANILGGGTSSRLWQKVREERGLAYSVGASTGMFNDCGFLAVSAATSPEQLGEVADIVIDELGSIVRSGIFESELDLMKDQARASILLGLEDSAGRAGTLAQCEMVHGRQISIEETLENLDAVTVDDVQTLAAEFFQSEKIAFVALGDLPALRVERQRLTI